MTKLVDSAILISILTAMLYCVGMAYYEGFCKAIGVPSQLLGVTFDQIIYLSTKLIYGRIVKISLMFFAIASFCFILKEEYANISDNIPERINIFLVALGKCFEKLANISKTIEGILLIVFATLFLFLHTLSHYQKKGNDDADNVMANIMKNQTEDIGTISILKNGNSMLLHKLLCGTQLCVSVDVSNQRLIYHNADQIEYTNIIK